MGEIMSEKASPEPKTTRETTKRAYCTRGGQHEGKQGTRGRDEGRKKKGNGRGSNKKGKKETHAVSSGTGSSDATEYRTE
jgi:hypothetical protein